MLGNFDLHLASGEDEIRALATFHIFGGGLREGSDDYRQCNRRVALDVSRESVFHGFTEELRHFAERTVRTGAGVRRLGANRHGIFMTARLRPDNI